MTLFRATILQSVISVFFVTSACAVRDGYIVQIDSPMAYMDWGQNSGVQPTNIFRVYRAGAVLKHPVTGEILGQAEKSLGEGVVDSVSEKFSTGHALSTPMAWLPGDRTRLLPAAIPTVLISTVASTVPRPIYVSTPMAGEPRGIAVGHLSHPMAQDLVIALKDRLEVYTWQDHQLKKCAVYNNAQTANWVTIDVGDPDPTGQDKIFATWYLDGLYRAQTVVLALSSGTLHVLGHSDGFTRALPHGNDPPILGMQKLTGAREFNVSPPKTLGQTNGQWTAGSVIPLPISLNTNQLFGFAAGDFDGDKTQDWAQLIDGERLRIAFKDKKWASSTLYGGTRLNLSFSDSESVAALSPRMLVLKESTRDLLLLPHNISATGLRLARLHLFHGGELVALAWNGLEMVPAWRVPSPTYIADFAVSSGPNFTPHNLWILADAPSHQAMLSGFELP